MAIQFLNPTIENLEAVRAQILAIPNAGGTRGGRILENIERLLVGISPDAPRGYELRKGEAQYDALLGAIKKNVKILEKGLREDVQNIRNELDELQTSLANRTDYRDLTLSQIAKEEKAGATRNAELRTSIEGHRAQLQGLADAFPDAGIELPPEPVRVKSGFIPASEAKEKDIKPSMPEVSEPSQLLPEEEAAAEQLADEIAESDLVYQPKVGKEDIERYITEGVKSAREESDPYYKEVIGRAREAYLQGIDVEVRFRELELRQEALNREQELKAARGSLEERGATFSGEAAELLGELSALPPNLRETVQGLLQEQQGMTASTSQMRFAENLARLTGTAEEALGTEELRSVIGSADTGLRLSDALLRFRTPTSGAIPRERETLAQTRGREIARGKVATELAQSPDFPSEKLIDFV